MRMATYQKVRTWLLSCLVFLTAAICMVLGVREVKPLLANAQEPTVNRTLQSGEYQTNGASMRVFKKTSTGDLVETEKQGIRFHVEMGSGYKHGAQVLFDETTKNERDAWVLADGYKTYTLILPKRLLSGDLTVDTDKVMQLETSEYWYTDRDGNLESVAYIYDIPEKWRTDIFCFKGIICTVAQDGTETVVAETETSERCLAYVAKMSYKDTIDPDTVTWGTESSPLDDVAAPLLKAFVPTYTINYTVGGSTYTEEVLWGDKPVAVPSFETPEGGYIEYTQSWFDKENHVEFNLDTMMDWTENKTFNLVQASAADFNLTGVADYNNFTVGSEPYSGVKLYATLAPDQFYTADEIANGTDKMVEVSTSAANFVLEGNGSFSGIQGVWTLLEGKGNGAQMRLIVAFDSTNMVNGDKIAIKEGAAFYANGSMYVLSQEYAIDYAEVNSVEDYGVFLGYLYNSDIKAVTNWTEATDATRKRIRVEFRKDVFINSDFKIVYDGELPAGYTYPLYVHCEQGGGDTEITQGYYYWNNGEHTILELEGFGHHGAEILYGVPGLKIVQNGGYFIFADTIKWEHNGSEWVEGREKGTFSASSFETKGENASDTTEARFTTNGNTTLTEGGMTDRWFNEVRTLTVENMSTTEPYAVFATNADGTVTPLNDFRFHGQSTGSGYNHILGFAGYEGTVAGETITILGGTRFWCGSEYYTASETIIFYYNGTNWIVNNDGTANKELTIDNFIGKNYNYFEGGINKLRMHLVEDASLFNGGNGLLTLESGSIKVNGRAYTNFRYHGQYVDPNDGLTKYHMIFEIIGDTLAPIGQEAFGDTLVIEAGTRIWIGINEGASAQPYCVEFPERLEWRYVGDGMTDGSRNPFKYEWIRTDANTDLDHTDIVSMYDATDAGGEVRMNLAAGTLTDSFYGYIAMDTSKGVPVVNGIEMPNEAFSYGMGNQLFAVRGGEYGNALENYIIIPKGSVWWTTQGSFTFVETIYGVVRSLKENGTGNWTTGFNTLTSLGDISAADFMGAENYTETKQDGTGTVLYKEIRVRISREYSNSYYGAMVIDGEAIVEKADGTQAKALFGQWYSGTAYEADHSIVSFRGDAMIDVTDGDVFTIKAGTKLILGGNGYHTLTEDVTYTYRNGSWQRGDFRATVTYNGTNATVSGMTEAMEGDTCTFTVTPNSGYAVTSVMVNGNELTLTNDNVYSFTAISGENRVLVTAKKLYAVTWSNPTGATISVSANGSAISSGATVVDGTVLTVNVTAAASHNVTGITVNGTAVANGGTYTVTGATTIAATTAIKTYTVTANCSGGVSVDAVTKTVQHGNNVTFTLNVPANATIKANGTVINGNTYTVSNVTGDTTVTFTTWYTVTVNAGNSTVSGVTNNQLVEANNSITITATGKTGYNVTGITANGTAVTNGGTYKVTGATTIEVATELKEYTVTASCSGGVSVDAVTKTVQHGNNVTFTLNVPANATIKANGTVINGNTYTVSNVTGDTTVTFTTWYTVTVNAGNSTVSGVTSGTMYESGKPISFTVADTVSQRVTGVTANGESIGTAAGQYSVTVDGTTTIAVATAEKAKYTVSWTNPTGATITVSANETGTVSNGGQVYVGQTLTVTITPSTGYRLDTVSGLGSVTVDKTHAKANTFTYTVGGNTTISATTVQMYTVSWKATNATYTVTNTTTGATISTSGTYVDTGTEISVKVAAKTAYNITGVSINNSSVGTAAGTYTHTVTSNTNITNTAESSVCIVEGTMILMADGTQKAVEDLQIGDMLMVFDHFSGQYVARPFIMDVHAAAAAKQYNVLNMTFSNGAIWRMVGHHTIFDTTLNQYVTISQSNVDQYVGHTFYYTDGIVSENVTMTGYYMTEEVVKVFSPTTYEFANYFANGFLNAPPLPDTMTAGQMNCFDFDENMQYVNVEADIEKYGLYTYEDFADYISEDVFNALPFKYFKVSVGKGLLTWDEIVGLISMV